MDGTFRVRIALGNDAMQSPSDIADALSNVANEVRAGYGTGRVSDANGNAIGGYSVDADDDDAMVEVDGLHVGLSVKTDGSGSKFVQLAGLDCSLEGEAPGDYYPVRLEADDERCEAPLCEQPRGHDGQHDHWHPDSTYVVREESEHGGRSLLATDDRDEAIALARSDDRPAAHTRSVVEAFANGDERVLLDVPER